MSWVLLWYLVCAGIVGGLGAGITYVLLVRANERRKNDTAEERRRRDDTYFTVAIVFLVATLLAPFLIPAAVASFGGVIGPFYLLRFLRRQASKLIARYKAWRKERLEDRDE